MFRFLAFILIAAGLVSLGMGFMASESAVSEVSKFFTGEPSDKSIYYIGASIIMLPLGAIMALSSRRSSSF